MIGTLRGVLLALLVAVGGSLAPASAAEPSLVVFSAASLTETVQALAARYPGARLAPSFGASSVLARQIKDGAPADVFLSASREWIDFLRDADALDGDAVVLAHNRLVCIASPGPDRRPRGATDLASLLAALGPDGRVAIADEGVPAGEYARASLGALGLLQAYTPLLVGQPDVRAVLHAVESGALDAGFVYSTDVRVAKVEVLFTFDPGTHPAIEYQAAVPRNAPHAKAGHEFLEFLRSDAARKALTDAGFTVP